MVLEQTLSLSLPLTGSLPAADEAQSHVYSLCGGGGGAGRNSRYFWWFSSVLGRGEAEFVRGAGMVTQRTQHTIPDRNPTRVTDLPLPFGPAPAPGS